MGSGTLPAVIDRQAATGIIPAAVAEAGGGARFAWEEFFIAGLRNPHTRRAYAHAVRRFLAWCDAQGHRLHGITPGLVGRYFDRHPASIPTKKQHLAALRGFFDTLVRRHVVIVNPAASVRAERYQVIDGKTPEITAEQARTLFRSIGSGDVVGLRDRAIIAILSGTAVRIGAVAKLRRRDFRHDGGQWTLRFEEKGGKSREIPLRRDVERAVAAYLEAARKEDMAADSPLFRTAVGKTKTLSRRAMSAGDMGVMVKRRLKAAGLPERLSPHSFRVAVITNLLDQGMPLEEVQLLAGHADPRTTRLYDRRQRRVSRATVERIAILDDH